MAEPRLNGNLRRVWPNERVRLANRAQRSFRLLTLRFRYQLISEIGLLNDDEPAPIPIS